MRCIVYTRPDGGVTVCRPVWPTWMLPEEEEAWTDWIVQKDVPADATNVTVIDDADLPEDVGETRGQWRQRKDGTVFVDDTVVLPEQPVSEIDALKARIARLELDAEQASRLTK
jgi:hypothetical protein